MRVHVQNGAQTLPQLCVVSLCKFTDMLRRHNPKSRNSSGNCAIQQQKTLTANQERQGWRSKRVECSITFRRTDAQWEIPTTSHPLFNRRDSLVSGPNSGLFFHQTSLLQSTHHNWIPLLSTFSLHDFMRVSHVIPPIDRRKVIRGTTSQTASSGLRQPFCGSLPTCCCGRSSRTLQFHP